jgi:hypothetical protein
MLCLVPCPTRGHSRHTCASCPKSLPHSTGRIDHPSIASLQAADALAVRVGSVVRQVTALDQEIASLDKAIAAQFDQLGYGVSSCGLPGWRGEYVGDGHR